MLHVIDLSPFKISAVIYLKIMVLISQLLVVLYSSNISTLKGNIKTISS